jgi:transcriptional regulatory protein LevR
VERPLRKDVREFIRRLEAVGLTIESTPVPSGVLVLIDAGVLRSLAASH